MFAAGEGAILEFVLTLFVKFMSKFIGRAGEWVFQDAWHTIGVISLTIGGFALLIYLRGRKPEK